MISSRTRLTALLALVFVINYVETAGMRSMEAPGGDRAIRGHQFANALHWLEGGLSFEYHDATNMVAVYGCSIAYFFVFPVMGLAIGWALARRDRLSPYRVFVLAVVLDYAISLVLYLVMPVPERWAYPESAATLLSDHWTTGLITAIRPISGLYNSFPSFHVSLTTVFILVSFLFGMRLRVAILALGSSIILSTFLLGIHWSGDILAGLGTGMVSVWQALNIDDAMTQPVTSGNGTIPHQIRPAFNLLP